MWDGALNIILVILPGLGKRSAETTAKAHTMEMEKKKENFDDIMKLKPADPMSNNGSMENKMSQWSETTGDSPITLFVNVSFLIFTMEYYAKND